MSGIRIECFVAREPIDPGAMLATMGNSATGATNLFVGTVRESSLAHQEKRVVRLEYEAYVSMAERELTAIAHEASSLFQVSEIVVHHRIGKLEIGDIAVAAAVSAPHRAAAFDASRFVIEELKKRVPIWKREVFEDGAEWVNARP